ncbi:MAG: hypothetical protein CSA75_04770, partial [Sorangium cellulosum]
MHSEATDWSVDKFEEFFCHLSVYSHAAYPKFALPSGLKVYRRFGQQTSLLHAIAHRSSNLQLETPLVASHEVSPIMVAMSVYSALAPGAMIGGDFRVVRPLGAGGMGAVYVAEQLSTGRQRALKVMDPRLVSDRELRERFANEARVGAHMESDHVVEVVSAGVDDATDMPWLAMALLQGMSLSQNLQQFGRLHPANVSVVVAQLCHALEAAHRVGVVHRDLKPENIFLAVARREGVPFTVKVLDFGIAKILQGTQIGMTSTLGTPLWMAPEQTSPGARILPATDIWAVGLLVFWMLTGTSYWRSASIHPPSLTGLMREIVLDPIEPPSLRAGEFGVLFSPALDAWFAHCLERDPAHRFSSATACRKALDAALAQPTNSPPFATVSDPSMRQIPIGTSTAAHAAELTEKAAAPAAR